MRSENRVETDGAAQRRARKALRNLVVDVHADDAQELAHVLPAEAPDIESHARQREGIPPVARPEPRGRAVQQAAQQFREFQRALAKVPELLGVGPADPYQSDAEPGFEAPGQAYLDGSAMTPSGVYAALPGNTPLNFAFQPITIGATTRNLFFWNGTGAVSFSALTGTDSLSLIKSGPGG